MPPVNSLHVKYCASVPAVSVGRLALVNRKIFFEYTPSFLQLGLELSPFKLPLKNAVIACEDRIFDGLFGVFNDSLPDGWGRLLLDRKLLNSGINPATLTPLDRLRYVGTRGMGALQYEPEIPQTHVLDTAIEIDTLAEEARRFQVDDEVQFIDNLLLMNGSSAGARPKILVSIDPKTHQVQLTDNCLSHSHDDWIVKFRSSVDPRDIGPIEYAYHLMARAAGLSVPEAKIFQTRTGPGYFGVKRFDRTDSSLLHMHTLSGLLHADHRIPSLDYEAVMKATCLLTRDVAESETQFRNAAFNVFAHNRDDHAKNFSFLMNDKGVWSVSPAYDLTFSSGPGGEHCTTVMGNGRNPGTQDLIKLATIAEINQKRARVIIEEVRDATSRWPQFAQAAGVSRESANTIHHELSMSR